MISIYSPWK